MHTTLPLFWFPGTKIISKRPHVCAKFHHERVNSYKCYQLVFGYNIVHRKCVGKDVAFLSRKLALTLAM